MPVVLEVRPGVYQKNAQVAHIYGVRPGTPRYRPGMPAEQRDSFANLLLLCLAHHEEVDGKDGEKRYPPPVLKDWKRRHENTNHDVLNSILVPHPETLMRALVDLAEEPLGRLEAITKQLEETGIATAEIVADLKLIAMALSRSEIGIDSRTALRLSYAAEVLGDSGLSTTARNLANAAEVLPGAVRDLERAAKQMQQFM